MSWKSTNLSCGEYLTQLENIEVASLYLAKGRAEISFGGELQSNPTEHETRPPTLRVALPIAITVQSTESTVTVQAG